MGELSLLELAVRKHGAAAVADAIGDASIPWEFERRPKQRPPEGDWRFWAVIAGRGFGKTRTGCEWVLDLVEQGVKRIAVAGRTSDDVRETLIEGESGLLACARARGMDPLYKPTRRLVIFHDGARVKTYSADRPDVFRGPNLEAALLDEFAAWRYAPEAWANLQLTLRIGNPRACITTTPRPIPVLRELLKRKGTVITQGTTYENRTNLAPEWYREIIDIFESTRLGRQELEGILLGDTEGALWTIDQLDKLRVTEVPPLIMSVVGVDPAVSTKEGSAETGIIAVGAGKCQCKGLGKEEVHLFVLEDATGDRVRPNQPVRRQPLDWANVTASTFERFRCATVIGEINNGGNLVEANLRQVDKLIPYTSVHASEGKRTRAEPISALYEQGRVHHVGTLATLEDQMTTWDAMKSGERSPDRVDALVHACTHLLPLVRSGIPAYEEKHKGFTFGVTPRM